jgi:CubicO group peptidase (beta-lactamase class C family)
MAEYMARWEVGAARIAVLRDGEIVHARGYGDAASADEPVLLASLTKALTAGAILALVEDGRLALDDRIDAIPGVFAGLGAPADPRLGAVTLRQLLTHRAGLPGNDRTDPVRVRVAAKDPSAARDAVLRKALARPLAFAPGSAYRYSNPGYLLLGRIVETVSGRPYLDFLRARVLDGAPARLDPEWPQLEAAGAVLLSPVAYARFIAAAAPALAAGAGPGPGLRYGFGVMLREGDIFHFGSWNQNRTFFLLRPDGMGAVVALAKRLNAPEPSRDLDRSLRAALDAARQTLEGGPAR